ncbi:phosphatase PAP2 family protein [Kribbella sp. DT2]|uniref:phosphatase PAP2 family protein n=1 Tax=Kribbella sp. DT2 TaxID=3393427 RepID=UPI003CF973B7
MAPTDLLSRPTISRYAVPVAGALVAFAGTLSAIALGDSATEADGLAAFDPELTADAIASRTAPLTAIARALTFTGSTPVLVVLTLLAAALLLRTTRSWRAPGLLLLAMAGSSALSSGLKLVVGRHRPSAADVIGTPASTFAFPSGHTLNSTVFFCLLAGLVWLGLRSTSAKLTVAAAAVLLSVGIGLSRIYLGYHWATDVLAGWTIAVTWLAIVVSVAHWLRWLPRTTAA